MDNVLKRRLLGATILIALAVIFVPMLLVEPDAVEPGEQGDFNLPAMPESAREVRRIPLDPETARVPPPETSAEAQQPEPAEPTPRPEGETPSDEIVLRPDLAGQADPVTADPPASSGADDSASEPTGAGVAPRNEPTAGGTASGSEAALGDWIVQVASFGSEMSAEEVRQRLETLGHIVRRDQLVRGDTLLYRLRTGPYPSEAAAETARAQIEATVRGVDPVVRRLDGALGGQAQDRAAGFVVQVGLFASAENAESETGRLTKLGFEAFKLAEQVSGREITRVLVGPVPERAQAEALRLRLDEEAGVEGFVVSYP